jgi:uncharacterized membrane protein YwzB
MSTQRNLHIAAFRKVSGYLLWIFPPLLLLLYLGGPAAILAVLFAETGNIDVLQSIIRIVDKPDDFGELHKLGITFSAKIFLFTSLLFFTIPFIYIVTHVQKLVQCFQSGDIFNLRALTHARKAYRMNLYFSFCSIVIHFTALCFAASYLDHGNAKRIFDWIYSSGITLIDLAFYSLILWALEIGTNLNEEVELTI